MADVVIGVPFKTRLLRIERGASFWRLWLESRDFKTGTYLLCHDSGMVERVQDDDGENMTYLVKEADNA